MAVDGCGLVCKYIIILFNCIFAVLGLVLAGFGLWLRFSDNSRPIFEIKELNSSAFVTAVTVMIVLGAVMLIVATFGDFGSCSENRSSLQVFSCLIAILAGAVIVIGSLAFKYHDKVTAQLVEFYGSLYALFKTTGDPVMGQALIFLHKWLHCCGATGFKLEDINDKICPDAKSFLENFKLPGCPSTIATVFDTRSPLVIGFFVGTGALLIFIFICSVILSKAMGVAAASPQYIILTPSTPCSHPQPPLPSFPNSDSPQNHEPVVFTPLSAANIPALQV